VPQEPCVDNQIDPAACSRLVGAVCSNLTVHSVDTVQSAP